MENVSPNIRTVEEIYQKKTQLEHILLRPDTYIGSIESETDPRWLFDPSTSHISLRRCTFTPGLFKIFDEILVNAADNKQRDPSMTTLKVTFNTTTGCITVYNDGRGIPIELHKEHGVYVPELIFGHLLTSSNYNDSEKKTVGGRNGYGAKLANIFSTSFTVTTQDNKHQQTYTQTWGHNMQHKGEPIIKTAKGKDFTQVSFIPDYTRFGCEGLISDMLHLMMRRVWDIAGTSDGSLKVFMNEVQCKVTSFSQYVAMFTSPTPNPTPSTSPTYVYERCNSRWELCVGVSDGHFTQMSWVNSIATTRGGSHVTLICDQLVKALTEHIEKKFKKVKLKPAHVKAHLSIHLNCLIDNPAFDTQTKEYLTTKKTQFGSTCDLSPAFIKGLISRTPLVESIVHFASYKESEGLKKGDGKKNSRITGIPKLDDANDAGTKHGHLCTLILTEGDSAKALAVSGLSVVGRDRYGVFPLRGKLLNVREASTKQIMENAEVTALKKILGLQQGKVYNNADNLRYGHIMIMTDQDYDGSHIKGLIINLFATFWPSLLRLQGFLTEFITPIVKVKHGRTKVETAFYTLPEFLTWKASIPPSTASHYSIKYYKGLGTSTSLEAQTYFSAISRHQLQFTADPTCDSSIELAFGKSHADARKEWLGSWTKELYLDQSQGSLTYSDFVNRELILFSVASNQRAIPSLVDGLKPGQRKILYSCFLKKLNKEIKVAQLAGYVSEKSAYHHGEAALTSTIVGMAQSYVGSNNLNLLYPSGMFGTRLAGGKDAASARYIFTHLCPIARAVFPAVDDGVLSYLNDDGLDIEPEWYLPVVPMVLVNGSSGIGTGWSSTIPNYNQRDLVQNLTLRMKGQPMQPLHPWYHGFDGLVQPCGGGKYQHTGRIEEIDDTTLVISELPIGVWTSDYKLLLEQMIEAGDIKGYREYHTDTRVSFVLQTTPEQMQEYKQMGLYKKFKLLSTLTTSNMVLFNAQGRLQRYDSVEGIMEEFYGVRLEGYRRRKVEELRRVGEEVKRLGNKTRFILAVVTGEMAIRGVKKAVLLQSLVKGGYDPIPRRKEKTMDEKGEGEKEEEEGEGEAIRMGDYEYLLGLPLWSLTLEKVEELKAAKEQKEKEWAILKATTEEAMWQRDLEAFLVALDAHEEEERKREDAQVKVKGGEGKGKGKGRKETASKEPPKGTFIPPPDPTQEKEGKEKKPRATKKEVVEGEVKEAKAVKAVKAQGGKASAVGKGGKEVKGKGKGKAKKEDSEDEEDRDEMDSDVEILESPIAPRAPRPTRIAAVKRSYVEEENEEEDEKAEEEDDGEEEYKVVDDDDFVAMTKPAVSSPPTKPIRAPVKAKVSQPKVAVVSGGGEGLSLSERLALRMQGMGLNDRKSSPPSKPSKPSTPPKAAKASSPPKPLKPTASKRPLSKAKATGEMGQVTGAGVGLTPEAKKVKGSGKEEVKEVRVKRTAVKAKYVEEDSEDEVKEMDEGSDSDWED